MDLAKHTLEEWLKSPPAEALKMGGDTFPFYSKYETFKHYLENNLHKEVTKQAIYEEFRKGKDHDTIIFLNDHGPDHIKTVIQRASQLLDNGQICPLKAREVFFLLNAIQVHDIGNFYGRIGHESKVFEAISDGLTPILFDSTEANYIKDIAQVHGGKIVKQNGTEDKNTIGKIKPEVTSDGYQIRKQLLAAILRFADELADDKYRADSKSLDENRIPKGSEVFHAYASCLDTVKIVHEKNTVELHFKVPRKYLLRTFGKIQKDNSVKQQYLIDEIYERSLKMHLERIYCAKFWKKYIDIDKIWVQIEFYANTREEGVLNEGDLFVYQDITFTLHDQQYPDGIASIHSLCPDLNLSNGKLLTGSNLRETLENKSKPKANKGTRSKTSKTVAKKTVAQKAKTAKKVAKKAVKKTPLKKPVKKIANKKVLSSKKINSKKTKRKKQ